MSNENLLIAEDAMIDLTATETGIALLVVPTNPNRPGAIAYLSNADAADLSGWCANLMLGTLPAARRGGFERYTLTSSGRTRVALRPAFNGDVALLVESVYADKDETATATLTARQAHLLSGRAIGLVTA